MTSFPLLAVQTAAASSFERWAALFADLATIVIAVALIVGAGVAIHASLRARAFIRRTKVDVHPAIRSLTTAAGHVEEVSRMVREEGERLRETVADTNDKVRRATAAAEARLGELDVLIAAAQREAEEAFVRTAAAVRGVHAGTEALRLRGRHTTD